MVDRVAPLDAMKCGMVLAVGGVLAAMAGRWLQSLPLFAFGTFISASAAVVGFLAESASVQAIVPGAALPSANARLQLVQSAAMLIGALAMGYAVLQGWTMAAYALALLRSCWPLVASRLLWVPIRKRRARRGSDSRSPRWPTLPLRVRPAAPARNRCLRPVLEHGFLCPHGDLRTLRPRPHRSQCRRGRQRPGGNGHRLAGRSLRGGAVHALAQSADDLDVRAGTFPVLARSCWRWRRSAAGWRCPLSPSCCSASGRSSGSSARTAAARS
jgi:hypothetical protein